MVHLLILAILILSVFNIVFALICSSLLDEIERLNKDILDRLDEQIRELEEEISKNVFNEELE